MKPPDEVRRGLVRRWLCQAEGDLAASRLLLLEDLVDIVEQVSPSLAVQLRPIAPAQV